MWGCVIKKFKKKWLLFFSPYKFFARPIQILKSKIFQRVLEVFMSFEFYNLNCTREKLIGWENNPLGSV